MGNINRRSSLRAAQQQHANEWGEASVGKMISENKLAPIVSPEGEAQNEECPICFLDFSSINTVICCKQQICTGCVVQLHTATAKASCPFCSNQELKVTYTKKERVPIALSASPDKDAGDCDFSDQASSRSSTSSVNLSYTTPEQERKIRSLSYDNNSNLLSRSDREALEAQIRDQRRQSEEEECVAAARGSPSLSLRESYLRAQSASLAQRRRTGGMAGGTRNQSYRLGGTATGSGSPGLADDNRNGRVGENRFLDSLHGLLTSQDRVTSIQQLEDIMLMEVSIQTRHV
ncbi:hypothetical protein B484DRAFT_60241 [Ochromonadaceae sp. CCMP2298]|nr:hypothetical protein B484DRAFT_60241 [Ochromonadaceae sp. CCMP2298]